MTAPGSTVEHPDHGSEHVHGHFACVVLVEGFKADRFSEASVALTDVCGMVEKR